MDVFVLEEVARQPKLVGPHLEVGEGRKRRLLHHVAELTGQAEFALPFGLERLDEEDVAANRRPGEARGNAWVVDPLDRVMLVALGPEVVRERLGRDVEFGRSVRAVGDLDRHLAADIGNLSLERPHACFAGVAVDDLVDGADVERHIVLGDAVVLELLGQQELTDDVALVVVGVAGDLDDLHAIAERRRDGVHLVGVGDEEDLGEVDRDLYVVVAEGIVLLGVEHLEEGRLRVAAEVTADLVDLVEHDDRVDGAGLAERLCDAARECADIGAAVAANLRLVVHAAERDADELAVEGAGDRAAERGLADAGRPDEAEDGPLHVAAELADREELDEPLLDLVEAVVVFVEDGAGVRDVEVVDGRLAPRQVEEGLDVGADDAELAARGLHLLQTAELLLDDLVDLVGHLLGVDAGLEIVEVAVVAVDLAELLLDGLVLLPEVVLLLVLIHLLFDLVLDLVGDLRDLELASEEGEDQLEPLFDVGLAEHLLLLLDGDFEGVGGEVGEVDRVCDLVDHERRFARKLRHHAGHTAGHGLEVVEEGVDLDVALILRLHPLKAAHMVGLGAGEVEEAHPLLALDDNAVVVVADLHDLEDAGHDADAVEVGLVGLVDLCLTLGDDGNVGLFGRRLLDEGDGLLTAHLKRDDHLREEHRVAEWEDGENQLAGLAGALLFFTHGATSVGVGTEEIVTPARRAKKEPGPIGASRRSGRFRPGCRQLRQARDRRGNRCGSHRGTR